MRVRRAVLVGIVLLSGLVAAPAGAQDSTLTREAALQTARDFESANAENNATLDTEGQGAIEADPVRAIDDATFRELRGRGETTLGRDIEVERRRVYVPQRSGSLQHFLSSERVAFDSGSSRQVLLFTRPTDGAPFKVSMAAELPGPLPRLYANRDRLARLVNTDTEARLKVRPGALAGQLAKLWDSGRSTSKTFEPGPFSTGALDRFVQTLSALGIPETRVTFTFETTDDEPVCFETRAGGALCLFVLAFRERLRPTSGGAFVQPQSRQLLTGLVVPGEYREVNFERTAILAANVPEARDRGARVDVIGIYEGLTDATATLRDEPPAV
jgi:hypothetical protein